MDLEELTKHQIILLTLLVSFVTSIATGIVTVSLMSQVPTSVTRTINQIVERTVQTVAPSKEGAAVATIEKTVVVKDDDLTAQSIASVQKSIIRVFAKGSDDLLARGVIVDSKGGALTDRAALNASAAVSFEALLPNGKRVPLTISNANAKATTSLVLVDLAVGTSTSLSAASFADVSKLHLGQSVMRIGGKGQDTVGGGVIASLPDPTDKNAVIEASVPSSTAGSVLITLFGEIVGITTAESLLQGSDFYGIIPSLAVPVASSVTKPPPKP